MTDFVAPQISWGQKAAAISKIGSTLNLQTRHMVFLDDRPDERALVNEAFPDLLTLDPCDPETWKRIDLWSEMSFGSSDIDRTRLYQEQARRDEYIQATAEADALPNVEALKTLGLKVSIRQAERTDLKRVVELINRTNQWNLCGTRTSLEQVRAWHESSSAQVLVADAADRFGSLGTVCVSVVEEGQESAEILVFVLSCRVFGYGVESAMLREISRRCEIGGRLKLLVGHFRSNAQNHPCWEMYPEHGFAADGEKFRWTGTPQLPEVPRAEVRAL